MKRRAPDEALDPPDPAAYEHDFVRWIERQVRLMRAKQFAQLDLDNVIEEFDAMGRSQRHELRSRLEALLMHLLKCQFQPERKSGSWLGTLREQRSEVARLIEASRSLRKQVPDHADRAYEAAHDRAAAETGLSPSTFPAANPYSADQLLDPRFVP